MSDANQFKQQALEYHQQGNLAKARELYQQSLQLNADDVDVLNMLATLEASDNNKQKALLLLEQAIKIEPEYGYLFYSKAMIQLQLADGKTVVEDAIIELKKALKFEPKLQPAKRIIASLYQQQGQFAKAIDELNEYQQLFGLEPEIDVELGYCYQKTNQLKLAIAHYEKSLNQQPNADVLFNLAMCQTLSFNWQLAEKNIHQALLLTPKNLKFLCWQLYIKKLNCNWQNYEEEKQHLEEQLELSEQQTVNSIPPGYLLNVLGISDRLHAKVISHTHKITEMPEKKMSQKKTLSNDAKINIGYLSADFRNHAVGMLLAPIIEHHDKTKFNLFGYSLRESGDTLNLKFKNEFEVYKDLSQLPSEQIAQQIAEDKIDILIDLGGMTDGARPEILAFHPAPVQIGLWGYLNSIGGGLWDYIITDKTMWPETADQYYTEKPLFLDRSILSSGVKFGQLKTPVTNSQYGFPEDAIVVASFNNSYKITQQWYLGWLSLIEKNENCWFWLYVPEPHIKAQLIAVAKQHKIDTSRVIYAEKVDYLEHLKRMTIVDLFADSFEYNAGASATAATISAVPILTLKGDSMLSRMGASINSDLGMQQLTCNSIDQYWLRARELLSDKAKLKQLKTLLRTNISNREFGNGKAFCASLESAYVESLKIKE